MTTTIATSSQCARSAARFRGATTRTTAISTANTAQISQFATSAKVVHVSEVASAWMMITGIIASVATSTAGSNGVLTRPDSACSHIAEVTFASARTSPPRAEPATRFRPLARPRQPSRNRVGRVGVSAAAFGSPPGLDSVVLDPVSCLGDTDCDRRDRDDHSDNDPEEDCFVEQADFEVHSHHGRQQRAGQQDH